MRGKQNMPLAELPCEKASRLIIPSIRAALVKYLIEHRNLTRYHVAKLLGITPASVTNYMKGERGTKLIEQLLMNQDYYRVIEKMADVIIRNRGLYTDSAYVQYKDLVCTLCSQLNEAAKKANCPPHGHNGVNGS